MIQCIVKNLLFNFLIALSLCSTSIALPSKKNGSETTRVHCGCSDLLKGLCQSHPEETLKTLNDISLNVYEMLKVLEKNPKINQEELNQTWLNLVKSGYVRIIPESRLNFFEQHAKDVLNQVLLIEKEKIYISNKWTNIPDGAFLFHKFDKPINILERTAVHPTSFDRDTLQKVVFQIGSNNLSFADFEKQRNSKTEKQILNFIESRKFVRIFEEFGFYSEEQFNSDLFAIEANRSNSDRIRNEAWFEMLKNLGYGANRRIVTLDRIAFLKTKNAKQRESTYKDPDPDEFPPPSRFPDDLRFQFLLTETSEDYITGAEKKVIRSHNFQKHEFNKPVRIQNNSIVQDEAFRESKIPKLTFEKGASVQKNAFLKATISELVIQKGVKMNQDAFAGAKISTLVLEPGADFDITKHKNVKIEMTRYQLPMSLENLKTQNSESYTKEALLEVFLQFRESANESDLLHFIRSRQLVKDLELMSLYTEALFTRDLLAIQDNAKNTRTVRDEAWFDLLQNSNDADHKIVKLERKAFFEMKLNQLKNAPVSVENIKRTILLVETEDAYVVPDWVTGIPMGAFMGYEFDKPVIIKNSISVGPAAFAGVIAPEFVIKKIVSFDNLHWHPLPRILAEINLNFFKNAEVGSRQKDLVILKNLPLEKLALEGIEKFDSLVSRDLIQKYKETYDDDFFKTVFLDSRIGRFTFIDGGHPTGSFYNTKISELVIQKGAKVTEDMLNKTTIKKVILENGSSVGENAFAGQKIVNELVIQKGAALDRFAFEKTTIPKVTLKIDVVVGPMVFNGSKIEELIIHKDVKIWNNAFRSANILKVTLMPGAEFIPDQHQEVQISNIVRR
jgi:hypothetical protein